jgi:hypothetical protein
MAKKIKEYPAPEFQNIQEEDEYWKTHSPLDEGYEGKLQKTRQKRSSFLSIRLTGEELSQIRDIAEAAGTSPSAMARQFINNGIEIFNRGGLYPAQVGVLRVHDKLLQSYDRADTGYTAARNELETVYKELRKKASDALDNAREGDPVALHTVLNAIFEMLWATLVMSPDAGNRNKRPVKAKK